MVRWRNWIVAGLLALTGTALALMGAGAPALAQQSVAPALSTPAPATPPGPTARSRNVEVTLIAARDAVAPGETFTVGVRQVMADGWHTYWRNSGDSGDATTIEWTLPDGVTAGPIQWPAPMALPFQTLVNYGYEGRVTLPVAITVPASAAPGTTLNLAAFVSWLECADICIPADATLAIAVPVAATGRDSAEAPAIAATLAALPVRLEAPGVITDAGGAAPLVVSLPVAAFAGARSARFFPHEIEIGALIDYAAPQELQTGPQGLSLTIPKSPSFPDALEGTFGGVLVVGEGDRAEAFEVSLAPGPVPAGVQGTRPQPASGAGSGTGGIGLLQAALFAFLGGLILNLMPCVFPILAMKALSLSKAAAGVAVGEAGAARCQGLLYGAGVLVTFVGLGATLAGLQAAGMAAGWGFQLQSSPVVLVLAALMFLIGLNLLGAFEMGGGVQGLGSELAKRGGAAGSFFSGVLAVVVASPCTAPFMGAALGFAATSPPLVGLVVFAALGIGFALPFVAVTFAPGLLARLPRPGAWMERLKQGLAFPMFATAGWLVWVLAAQAGQAGVLAAMVAAVGLGLAVWMAGAFRSPLLRGAGVVVGLGALVLAAVLSATAAPGSAGAQAAGGGEQGAALAGAPWSPGAVEAALAGGKTVLVNFTADWCVTCKVNEGAVFTDPEVRAALDGTTAVYLVGDWTRRDSAIAEELRRHGRIGVPLYLVYRPGEAEPEVLPQLLSRGTVLEALR